MSTGQPPRMASGTAFPKPPLVGMEGAGRIPKSAQLTPYFMPCSGFSGDFYNLMCPSHLEAFNKITAYIYIYIGMIPS